ncbi:hydroxymethylbilane synthase [Blastopirellula marina]|uniref:Porphobilinogen deaminase n=1 Tax=Blastopirellula marina TaxID=124 RepID=A0A2S8FU58_9BACT|nr:hydroxymethylbilane synthase [Blastopirellula marina]PQO35384.1 hydroxymethylbilane synthase [Blastopirellula marina]PQO41447.1 hydroxymethylbilane synthase [Blastopirellula marina]PTL44024.1 hydroxymethylbilane synthase [Blastopirellula marina]
MPAIRIGTRGSQLAQWQANWVADQLRANGAAVEIIHIATQGDVTQGPLDSIGGRGVFTTEIQAALLDHRIDVAVHSLKDLPTEAVAGLQLAAVPAREADGDVLISPKASDVMSLPHEAIIGTGSMRRKAQLLHLRRDLQIRDIRGNLDTRLRKLDDGHYDAIILAEAGLRRLELFERIRHVIPKSQMLPAVGQGALGLEIRQNDQIAKDLLAPLNHASSYYSVLAERSMLRNLRGGCLAPVGAWGRVDADKQLLTLEGVVVSGDGHHKISASACGPPNRAEDIGRQVADQLAIQGAERLIAFARATGN